MATSPWLGMKWMALALLALLVGFVWSWVAARQVRLWLWADHYVAAEMEVTRFLGKPRDSRARARIEGLIHPHGARVVTSDVYISVKQFIRPGDHARKEPLPVDIEGQRIAVSYWPRNAGDKRWWHPPIVVSRGQIPRAAAVAGNLLAGGVLLGFALFCFRRGFRYLAAAVPPEPA